MQEPAAIPMLLSFDVFGTLIDVRQGSYEAFRSILQEHGRADIDVRAFWEYWEERNIAHYWEAYRPYKEICRTSLVEAFARFDVAGDAATISRYFDAFRGFKLFPDVLPTLEILSRQHRLAIVSNIDNDLLAATPLQREFNLVCPAEKAHGYKPDGTLFRYLLAQAGVPLNQILHSGQSQFTDMVGGKPLGLTIAWINRRNVHLSPSVPKPDFTFADIASLVPLIEGMTDHDASARIS
jgi:2-haloacid dehalogenase